MPAISSASVLNNITAQSVTGTNETSQALQVICAWPVSGQYGPGSRVLYYVLIAACVLARKSEWLRNACLAGALLLPAVAALHGIVLAAVHVNGAVDMDVYGAFQLCSIGILAAPVVVRISRTYFYDPGRNIIFLWTGLILIGLLSLTVEFFRISTSPCFDDSGHPVSPDAKKFFYGTSCGLQCEDNDPTSPIRGGSSNNIYVIPAPDKLTFDTVTLLAAACCIPAILSLVSMWNKILKINWKTRFGDTNEDEENNKTIEGTNGATEAKMKSVNNMVRLFLSAVEIPIFAAAVFTILLCGERNFWSPQVSYGTEPIATIGQWAPIVGTGLAILGSLYLLVATGLKSEKQEANQSASKHQCTCSMHVVDSNLPDISSHSVALPAAAHIPRSSDRPSSETPITSQPSPSPDRNTRPDGKRRQVANALTAIGNYFGSASYEQFDMSEFRRGRATEFPEIPGEQNRNRDLPQIREQYNRPGSFTGSVASGLGARDRSATPSARSPTSPKQAHASTFPVRPGSFESQHSPTSTPTDLSRGRQRQRGNTLEVPSAVRYGHSQNSPSTRSVPFNLTIPTRQPSPAIVVSPDDSTLPPVHKTLSDPLASLSQPESSTPRTPTSPS